MIAHREITAPRFVEVQAVATGPLISGTRVQARRVLMHRIDQGRDAFGWRVLADAMAEIEDVAGRDPVCGIGRPEAVECGDHFGADLLGRREEHVRVEVALQRSEVADASAGGAQVDGPVQACLLYTSPSPRD